MLKISASQLGSLDRTIRARAQADLERLAYAVRPDLHAKTTPEVLRQFIDVVRAQAREVGFDTDFQLAVFLSAVLLQGRDFHLNPEHPLHQVVQRREVPSRLRANQLLYELERLQAAPAVAQ